MEFGAHLPIIAFGGQRPSLARLASYAEAAEAMGFRILATSDHLLFPRPWLDGPTALAAVLSRTSRITLATAVALPAIHGPVALAKALAAVDILSDGRLLVGVGAGSSPLDFRAAGVPLEERWKRLEESVRLFRASWSSESQPYRGRFYSIERNALQPPPVQQPSGPPIWIGSWGSDAGLRMTARLGDGWLASASNTTPEKFAAAWGQLKEHVAGAGKDPARFPNAISSMFLYITEDRSEAELVLRTMLGPTFGRSESEMRQRLLVGPAQECAEKLAAYRDAGVQRVIVWPVSDELFQLEMFQARVVPSLAG